LELLTVAYDADVTKLQVETTWIKRERCPPRNGPTQNLAGIVNNAPSMAATAVHACSYVPEHTSAPTPNLGPALPTDSTAELVEQYGGRVAGEIARLRVNIDRPIFAVFQAKIGYVQCEPDTSPTAIYCEAQSAESWEALASILTPARVGVLHAAGYVDPGRAPNYWKIYATDHFSDRTIAEEILVILHDVYGYSGLPALQILTEDSHR
jgi:hypothetical protein